MLLFLTPQYRFTANLLQPEPLSDERILWDKERKDPGFKASFYRNQISPESALLTMMRRSLIMH